MVEAARAAGTVVNVDFTRRWLPNYVAARVQVDKGRIGKLSQVIIEIGGERAMLWRNHPHAIDLMVYYAGADPEWVVGELEAGYEDYGTEYKGDGGKTTSTEPAANYYVAFRNGVRGYLTGMKDTMPGLVVTLRGPSGRLVVDEQGLQMTVIEQIGHGPQAAQTPPRLEKIVPDWTVAGMEAGIRDVIVGMETGRPTAGPAEHAWRSAAIIDARAPLTGGRQPPGPDRPTQLGGIGTGFPALTPEARDGGPGQPPPPRSEPDPQLTSGRRRRKCVSRPTRAPTARHAPPSSSIATDPTRSWTCTTPPAASCRRIC